MKRFLVAAGSSVLGTVGVAGLVLSMNATGLDDDGDGDAAQTVFQVEPPKKKKKKKPQKKAKPKPRKKAAKPPPPTPVIGANLSGLSFGIEGLEGLGPDGDLDQLLGDIGDVVMTQESVDEPPVAVTQVPPQVPERAVKKGITGRVMLSMLVTSEGSVAEVKVLEAHPPGLFETAAADAVRQWRFQPATYEGRTVPIRVTQTLRFGAST